ncbi:hypothetical protein GE061_011233 [Apolygus lucorum]|uniref:SEA domain-containing protein n=1 Tax=Apolygus lucorum TaxID=248454 RepID=A0A8S9XX54_APOLU|nr:hypothetical protein GE061_011233 [Apolygus lucorum]
MPSNSRIYCRTFWTRGMWLLLKALTLIWCSSLVSGLPVQSYNEKPQSNSTVVLQNSNTTSTTNVTQSKGPSVTPAPEVSEEPSSSLAPSSSSSSSTSSQLISSSSSSSPFPNDAPSSPPTPPSVPASSPSASQKPSSVELTTISYNSSVEEFTYSESNLTKLNRSSEEEFLKSAAADSVFNVTVIAGISALVILIAVLIGVTSFVLYRHLSWNRPQTLSDKFSNDESTGYIDDTAFRENSEEMYSLDNDSFLNSLEAMTIQNYWTDHVKHTKL